MSNFRVLKQLLALRHVHSASVQTQLRVMGQSEPVAAGRARNSKPAAHIIRNLLSMDVLIPSLSQYFHSVVRFV